MSAPILLPKLDEFLRNIPPDGDRATRCYHPSEVSTTECIRRLVYRRLDAPQDGSVVGPELRRVFDNGHGVHHRLQGYFARMGILRGWWRCLNHLECSFRWADYETVPTVCPSCASTAVEFAEVPILHPRLPIKGHADGIVDLAVFGYGRYVIEIKSMRSREWERLEVPKTEHVIQANLYLESAPVPVDGVIFLYENKDTQEIKEFVVARDPRFVEIGIGRVEAAEAAIAAFELPVRVCGTPDDWLAKRCPFRTVCFADTPIEELM